MWPFSKKPEPVIIDRDALKIKIFEKCGLKVWNPLNKYYKLVPDVKFLKRRSPVFDEWVEDFHDCNHIAQEFMAALPGYCVGMARVKWSGNMNHVLNIIMLEDTTMVFYDPGTLAVYNTHDYEVIDVWI